MANDAKWENTIMLGANHITSNCVQECLWSHGKLMMHVETFCSFFVFSEVSKLRGENSQNIRKVVYSSAGGEHGVIETSQCAM